MRTFVLVHGAGDSSWSWHLVANELRARGHDLIAPDLPAGNDAFTLNDYAEHVVARIGDRNNITVVGHSFGGFTAPIVADLVHADQLIYVAGMVPAPGETPEAWWKNTGFNDAVAKQAEIDGGLTGHEDPFIGFMHDVPHHLAEEAMSRGLDHSTQAAVSQLWPLESLPDIPTRFVLCRDDRFFPADLFRRLVPERLGIIPEEIDGSHCVMLADPIAVANVLLSLVD